MKDKDFYGSGQHPEAGSELVYINGKWHDTYDIYHHKYKSKYSEKVKNEAQKKLETKTTSHAGFFKSKVINNNEKSKREKQLDRLTIMKTNKARLLKELAQIETVIKSIECDLSI